MRKAVPAVLLTMILGAFAMASIACSPYYANAQIPCTPGSPGVETMPVQMVCPYVGASYETLAIKCPGDDHFRIDTICKLCGHRHYYNIRYWPDDYFAGNYYFYWGWFYPRAYWNQYWPYRQFHARGRYPIDRPVPLPHPRTNNNQRFDRPRTVHPPALPPPPRMNTRHNQPRNYPPPPPPQHGHPRPPSRPHK